MYQVINLETGELFYESMFLCKVYKMFDNSLLPFCKEFGLIKAGNMISKFSLQPWRRLQSVKLFVETHPELFRKRNKLSWKNQQVR